jgi:hypothetical protein
MAHLPAIRCLFGQFLRRSVPRRWSLEGLEQARLGVNQNRIARLRLGSYQARSVTNLLITVAVLWAVLKLYDSSFPLNRTASYLIRILDRPSNFRRVGPFWFIERNNRDRLGACASWCGHREPRDRRKGSTLGTFFA